MEQLFEEELNWELDLDSVSDGSTAEVGDALSVLTPEDNIPSWYKHYCKRFLSDEELDDAGIKNIELFFDPIHALMIEDMIAKKIGSEKWESVIKDDAKEKDKDKIMQGFRMMLNFHMLTPDKRRNLVFVGHIWLVNPTASKIRNALRIKNKEKFRFAYEGIRDLLTSDILDNHLDTKNIIAFDDGVLDMSDFVGGVRDGKPSDFVTTAIGYKIRFNSIPSMEEELDQLLTSLFPDDELRDYFLLHMSSCLDSGNLDKLFVIWYGLGNNETANFNKTLISFIQESDSRENMNIGVLKEMTGNDTIYTRNLFEAPKTIEVRCKFILVTNKIYNLSQADEATWARIRVIPFLSKFTNNIEEVDEAAGVFRMNPQYVRRVRKLAPYFMRLLMNTYPRYKAHGLPNCRLVQEHTSSLKRLNSPVALFVEDDLIQGAENSVRFQEAYEAYRLYARNNCGTRNITAANFELGLKKVGIDVTEGSIIGYVLREF
ncbi:hypothetical protein H4S03_000562 [Coemansia sp. S3946]|nr:hypothetical protein H4S03_000562 [Coemansia sp. S3946]